MSFALRALRRWGWVAPALGVLVSLVAGLVEWRTRGARYTAQGRAAGAQAADVLNDPRTAPLAAALAAAVPEPAPWSDEAALRKAVEAKGLLKDPALWPEVLPAPRLETSVDGERVRATASSADAACRAVDATTAAAAVVDRARRRTSEARIDALRLDLELAEREAGVQEDAIKEMTRQRALLQASAEAVDIQVEDLKAQKERTVARLRLLEVDLHRIRGALPSTANPAELTSPLAQAWMLERGKLQAERLRTPAGDPEVAVIDRRIQDLDLQIAKELAELRDKSVVALGHALAVMDAEIEQLRGRQARKFSDVLALSERLRQLAPKVEEVDRLRAALARETAAAAAPPLQVVLADAPSRSGGVRARVPWLAGLLGLVAGLLAALGLEAADRRVATAGDVKRRLGLGVVGLAPEVKGGGDPLLVRASPGATMAADYSLAAGVLRGYMEERDFKTVLVTGAAAGQGKSTAAANLAVALARKGMNVALVDADLRAPRQAAFFGIDDTQGLGTLLAGGELQPELPAGTTVLETLRVLGAGPAYDSPTELLESPRMAEILRALRERYDAVVIDGPPLGTGGDAVALARLADTTVWVIRAGRLPAARLGWAKHLLKSVGADVAGVLLIGGEDGAAEREYVYPAGATT
jgi:capsular exopolysaccharide synthesis family protein